MYHFENLKKGEKTAPIRVSGSYSYFPTMIFVENDTVRAKAFCFVGEKFYKSGSLIVALTIAETEEGRFLEFTSNR